MSEKKIRVTLYLKADNHRRVKELVEAVPGLTISGLVDEVLGQLVPAVDSLVALAKEGDQTAQAELMRRLLADQVFTLASDGTEIVRQLAEATPPGKDTM